MRAIAVTLVIADHMRIFQQLPGGLDGGFIGVDVFFVISGFLITGHLFKEIEANGRISFASFYVKRARRILPAAILVLLVGSLAAWLIFWQARAQSTGVDALWALFLMSNINFARAGTDYFSDGQASLFQHYWSLSVEEQFYLVWPLLILGAYLLSRNSPRPMRRVMLYVVAVVGILSFAWACISTAASPVTSYFSTTARAFEFMLGAMIAILAVKLTAQSWPRLVRISLSISGLALIAAAVILIDPGNSVPGPWALLPAVGAAVFIAAGTGVKGGVQLPILRSKPVGYIGNLSYSLYLWHWPVIGLTAAVMPSGSFVYLGVVAFSTTILSVITYHFVEQAFRYQKPSKDRDKHRSPKSSAGAVRTGQAASVVAAGLALTVVITAAASMSSRVPFESTASAGLEYQIENRAAETAVKSIQHQALAAIETDSWEGLSPAVNMAGNSKESILTDNCWNNRYEARESCILGDEQAENTLLVFGDSMAMNWVPALWNVVQKHEGWNLAVFAKVGCPYASVSVYDTDGSEYERCESFRSWALDQIQDLNPTTVILASALKKELPAAGDIATTWSVGAEGTIKELAEIENVFVLAPPPEGVNVASCANKFSSPSDCASIVSDLWLDTSKKTQIVTQDLGRSFIDSGLWFCLPNGICPSVIGDHVVRRDSVHMTEEYSRSLAPAIDAWLFPPSLGFNTD
ncbi:acyltransferase family protein [Paeniglutamicibacter sp. Y32M11]|uniref:acyltransferase family protein n=1 Tax=Paeniglutamicibacter sp. Y32M11 TaxID=2853258 RepID=UPI001C530CD8|nr:acyltransferase family protein [Paeniglutamicibacter sp. Y32M11]QXQ09622.1 acyltransferase [Paeniglutamicibacter sp. Y32M11]